MTLNPDMHDALRLTRAGDLGAATSLIQTMLAGGAAAAPPVANANNVIHLVPRQVVIASKSSATKAAASDARATPGTSRKHRYAGPAGKLDYHLYVPAGAAAGMPLVVMLHGCTQSPEDFARGTGMNALADELGFLVAYPGQSPAANAQKCWNWFKAGDQQRDHGEPALIAGVTREILREHEGDAGRVYVAGLSAGGAAAAIMAECYPDLFAAAGVHSGLACGSARDLPTALSAMRNGGGARSSGRPAPSFVPTIIFHGDRDATVNEVNGREITAAAAAAFGAPLETRTEQGRSDAGRTYTRETSVDASGRARIERWTLHGAGHAWSGGDASGSYTDPAGPSASREMLRFFLGQTAA